MRLTPLLLLVAVLVGSPVPARAAPQAVSVPKLVLGGVPFGIEVADPGLAPGEHAVVTARAGAAETRVELEGPGPVSVGGLRLAAGESLELIAGAEVAEVPLRVWPGWLSITPPLLAIILAIVFRQAVLALWVGLWLGAGLVFGVDPFLAFLRAVDTYVLHALTDSGHMQLILFTFAMGGMLGVISRTGGTRGIVTLLAPFARTPRSGQLAAWVMGLIVFFDDYANTLLVGNTMRPLTDRLRISREKLSYIVDSTAAPVASIALVSTWIGTEVGLIGDAFRTAGIERDAFGAFVASLPYRFYPIFALFFGFAIAITGRDFGPMLKAERRARRTGQVIRPGSTPLADYDSGSLKPPPGVTGWWGDAVIPLFVMVGAIVWFLYRTGYAASIAAGGPTDLKAILGNADSYAALLWGSFLGSAAALLLAAVRRTIHIGEAMNAWLEGGKAIIPAAVILTLAWSISAVCDDMQTAPYLVGLLGRTLNPNLLPALVFVICGFTSFATGTSWGTMGILIPLVIPLAHGLAPGSDPILIGSISSVLAGSVWGDHCSPISDTTVLSSMASSVDHMDHVNTQLPYAVVVGVVAVLVGEVPAAFGLPYLMAWVVGAGLLIGLLWVVGRKI